jgi:hypothetical protein
MILGIERASGTIVPTADDDLRPNDSLLLLTLRSARKQLLALFESAL